MDAPKRVAPADRPRPASGPTRSPSHRPAAPVASARREATGEAA